MTPHAQSVLSQVVHRFDIDDNGQLEFQEFQVTSPISARDGPMSSDKGTVSKIQQTLPEKWLRQKPQYGLDWLICAEFARQRTVEFQGFQVTPNLLR